MHGTWRVTGGGAGTGLLGCAAAGAAFAGAEWVIAWLWLIIAVGVASGALATWGAMSIGAWYDRRAVLATARWPVQQQLRAGITEPVAPPRRVTASGGVTINLINPTDVQMAAVIRKAIPGTAGDASIEGK